MITSLCQWWSRWRATRRERYAGTYGPNDPCKREWEAVSSGPILTHEHPTEYDLTHNRAGEPYNARDAR